MSTAPRLSPAQEDAVRTWFDAVEIIADHSWGLTDTVVLHVRHAQGESIIKAGGPGNHHIGREITAHEQWTTPWREAGRCARLRHADRELNMLATSYLPGTLVKDHPAADDPDTHRQAGELLARFHAQERTVSKEYESAMDAGRSPGWTATTASTPSPRPGSGTPSPRTITSPRSSCRPMATGSPATGSSTRAGSA